MTGDKQFDKAVLQLFIAGLCVAVLVVIMLGKLPTMATALAAYMLGNLQAEARHALRCL